MNVQICPKKYRNIYEKGIKQFIAGVANNFGSFQQLFLNGNKNV